MEIVDVERKQDELNNYTAMIFGSEKRQSASFAKADVARHRSSDLARIHWYRRGDRLCVSLYSFCCISDIGITPDAPTIFQSAG